MSENYEEKNIKENAMEWYQRKFPHRKLEESAIIKLYKDIIDYAKDDLLLKEFYRANHVVI
ncbi:MAG: hypothetical protein HQM12_06010 [SAR324 cluster bacterium]|nr:hypothetical protein [SAR324 cluster bacterium]